MRFSDIVLRFRDDAEFEQKHDRDENGRFSGARLLSGAKSNKQLKREHKNRSFEEFYGEEIKGRGLTGRNAVKKLIEEQRGHIKAAFHRDDLGDIDLAWGDTEAGLCHIFKRRLEEGQNVQEVINAISNVIANGEVDPDKERPGSYYIKHGKFGVSVSKDFKNRPVRLVLTGFKKE